VSINSEVQELLPWMINHRRSLHKIPEVCYKEFKTSEYIQKALTELGLSFETVLTGVVVRIKGTDPKRTLGFRADMDALSIEEKNECDYKSEHKGFMHACGHDGHMAILLGLAKYLTKNPPKNNVVLVFQPAEEGGAGAVKMIESGKVCADVYYALHLEPALQTGKFASVAGEMLAGAEQLEITFKGVGRHAQLHDGTRDAILASARFINDVEVLNTKNFIFHTGTIRGGSAMNVVADETSITCTMRFFRDEERQTAHKKIQQLLGDIKEQNVGNGLYQRIGELYVPLINTAKEVEKLQSLPGFVLAEKRFGGEDFAYFVNKYSGALIWVGAKLNGETLHSNKFDFDENALAVGLQIFVKLID
jgi:amidohydrolase